MLSRMHLIDYLNIIVLVPFAISICILLVLVTRKRKAYTLRSMKCKPNIDYVKARITAYIVLNENFPSMKTLARKLLYTEQSFEANSHNHDIDTNKTEETKSNRDRDSHEGDQVPDVIEKIVGFEYVLMEKLNSLYLILVQNSSDKKGIHNAIRFEMKQRCMRHPHDIFGAHIYKKISSLYQDVIDVQEKQTRLLRFRPWYNRIYCFVSHNSVAVLAVIRKGCIEYKNDCHKLVFFLVTSIATVSGLYVTFKLIDARIWLEGALLAFLVLMIFVGVLILKERDFYLNYTVKSLALSVSVVVFLDLGLHLYDYVTDIQVLYICLDPKIINMSFTAMTRNDGKTDSTVFNYFAHPGNLSEVISSEKLMYPIIGISAIFLIMTLVLSMIQTIPSISTIITKIKLTLLFKGDHKGSNSTLGVIPTRNFIGENKKKPVSTESIVHRNELSINEASYESSYQFLGQWLTYLILGYWMSLVTNYNRKLDQPNVTDIDLSNMYLNSSMITMQNTPSDAFGIKEISTFQILWKSGVISLVSISFCQLKMNSVQHEYSTSLLQKILYLIASVGNTIYFSSLVVMGFTTVVDILITISNITNGFVALCLLCFVMSMPPIMVKSFIWVVKSIFYDFHLHQKNIDEVSVKTSFANLVAYFNGPDHGILPTSPIKLYFKEKYYTSYHSISSSKLLDAFINHWIYYIFWSIIISILSAFRLYLMFGKISETAFAHEIDFSYGGVNPSCYNFQIICSLGIPLGWILENVFLYLYFMYDQGYFTGLNIHFQYEKGVKFRNPNLNSLTQECNSYIVNCGIDRNSGNYSASQVKEDIRMKTEMEKNVGEWVDLSGQPKFNIYKDMIIFTEIRYDDIDTLRSYDLDESERAVFEEIKHSFPFYRYYEEK